MPRVELFTRKGCHLCDDAHVILARVQEDHPFELVLVDIDADPALVVRYGWDIPVVHVDGEFFARHRVNETALRARLAGTLAS